MIYRSSPSAKESSGEALQGAGSFFRSQAACCSDFWHIAKGRYTLPVSTAAAAAAPRCIVAVRARRWLTVTLCLAFVVSAKFDVDGTIKPYFNESAHVVRGPHCYAPWSSFITTAANFFVDTAEPANTVYTIYSPPDPPN